MKTKHILSPSEQNLNGGLHNHYSYVSFSLVPGKIIQDIISKTCLKSKTNGAWQWQSKQECSCKATADICLGKNNSSS